MAATSSTVAKRLIKDDGRTVSKNSFSKASKVAPPLSCSTKSLTPRDLVGPGRTLLTVIPVPASDSARPRETASWAVLVMP